ANLFNYNPTLGDLLLDITVTTVSSPQFFLAVAAPGQETTTTRISASSSTATTGTVGFTSSDSRPYGLITRFDFEHPGGSLDSFEPGPGDLANYTSPSTTNASITAAAAHDGSFGLQLGNATEWMYRTDSAAQVAQGDVLSYWGQASGSSAGRLYLGFGASTN